MSIKILIQFNGRELTIPVNPQELKITQSASNSDIDIIGIGKTARKGEPGLIKTSIQSFFPSYNSYFYTGVSPKTCIDFINEIWNSENINNNVAKIVTLGLANNLNMYFVIENFTHNYKAGEEEDVYYTLDIKKYVPYGVKIVNSTLTGLASARATAVASNTSSNGVSNNTYTVQKGDCLWNITKACTGNGAQWNDLYNLNKEVIGNNPNLIKPGQVLTLPVGWSTPTNVTKLTNLSTTTSSKPATQQSTILHTPTGPHLIKPSGAGGQGGGGGR